MGARQRATAVLDDGTFESLADSTESESFVVGAGFLGGAPVVLAFTDGHVRGGTIGVAEAGVLARLAETVLAGRIHGRRPTAFIIGFDTGGVRVEEGPRGLAAASAVGVALARLTLLGVPLAAVISGPRGCFGALAVMAALPERIIMTAGSNWGLTGPRLLAVGTTTAEDGYRATSAETHLANGDAHAVVPDTAEAVRAQLCDFVARAQKGHDRRTIEQHIVASADTLVALRNRLRESPVQRVADRGRPRRSRDLLRYSFRGQWKPSGPIQRHGLVHAALGTLGERPVLSLIVGPEPAQGNGVGIEEAAVIADMIRLATVGRTGERAAILTFLFCQGHAVDVAQEQFGLPRALAECLRAMVAARLLGHPIVSVLGGGTYGAAYLALAAPSHRVLAMRGTSVAPMAPQVLQAFQTLRGRKAGQETHAQLADLIPDIRMVESVIRLPRVLREELLGLLATVRPEIHAA
jgi:malonate decarboxylase beta subunit